MLGAMSSFFTRCVLLGLRAEACSPRALQRGKGAVGAQSIMDAAPPQLLTRCMLLPLLPQAQEGVAGSGSWSSRSSRCILLVGSLVDGCVGVPRASQTLERESTRRPFASLPSVSSRRFFLLHVLQVV